MTGVTRQRMPATPRDVARVLELIESLARCLSMELDLPGGEMGADLAAVLHGLKLGFEGQVFPVPGDDAGDLGYRVAQTLRSGGGPWL